MKETTASTVDDYINQYPIDVQERLKMIRITIQGAAPDAVEKISYQMPCYYLNGNLVYYGAFKKHIGFYPTPSAIEAFKEELAHYKGSKGAVQFPYNQPMPLELIEKIVKFRVSENLLRNQKK